MLDALLALYDEDNADCRYVMADYAEEHGKPNLALAIRGRMLLGIDRRIYLLKKEGHALFYHREIDKVWRYTFNTDGIEDANVH